MLYLGTNIKEYRLKKGYTQEQLAAHGYNVARRTVAKYREQLGIPVARLRKE